MKHVNAIDFARLSKSHMEMSDHIVVLTAIVGAMVTSYREKQRAVLESPRS